jgi:hypothetical protein
MAQPEPELVASVLELVRRLDAVLHVVRGALAKQTVECDRAITLETVSTVADPYPDTRVADLARLAATAGEHGHAVIEAYATEVQLSPEEQGALGLFSVALEFDRLADELAEWAPTAPAPPPIDSVQATVDRVRTMLDDLGVPIEGRP